MADRDSENLGETLVPLPGTRIQLCGRLTVRFEGRRIEEEFPGRQGRLLFVYLSANRRRTSTRSELMDALWPGRLPAAADAALSSLLTKLRGILGAGAIAGKQDVRLQLPPDAWIDLEAATEGLHRATSGVAQRDWARAWGPSRVALHIALRGFLPGFEAPWIDEIRRRLDDVVVRAHECVAAIGLGLSGSELPSAERSARALIRLAPYRESGYRYLMEVLAVQGNVAEALLTYEQLRRLLRDELGAAPGPATQALHKRLLQGDGIHHEALVREIRTVLFTDIVGSTERAATMGDRAWRELLAQHYAVIRGALERSGGREIDTAGTVSSPPSTVLPGRWPVRARSSTVLADWEWPFGRASHGRVRGPRGTGQWHCRACGRQDLCSGTTGHVAGLFDGQGSSDRIGNRIPGPWCPRASRRSW